MTMNRYGHLLPGADADAANHLGAMVSPLGADTEVGQSDQGEVALPDDRKAQRQTQRLDRESMQQQAVLRDQKSHQPRETATAKKTKPITGQRVTHRNATQCNEMQERRAWDSNPQPVARHLNSNQLQSDENVEKYADSEQSAAPGAAVSAETDGEQADAVGGKAANQAASMTGHDADLSEVANRWATLPNAVRLAVMALVRSASR